MIQDQTAHVGMPAAGLPSALIMLLFAAYLLCTEKVSLLMGRAACTMQFEACIYSWHTPCDKRKGCLC